MSPFMLKSDIMNIFLKAIILWIIFIPIAIINGSIRQYVYEPIVGELLAHQISSIIGSILLFLLIYLFYKQNKEELKRIKTIYIGLFWGILTILFEFGFGHYIAKHPWSKLLHDYNILEGRIWILILLVSVISLPLISKIKNNH